MPGRQIAFINDSFTMGECIMRASCLHEGREGQLSLRLYVASLPIRLTPGTVLALLLLIRRVPQVPSTNQSEYVYTHKAQL